MEPTVLSLDDSEEPIFRQGATIDIPFPKDTKTEKLLLIRMPSVITDVVLIYFRSDVRFGYAIAAAGEYEECESTTAINPSMVGACIGGYFDILILMLARGADDFDWAITTLSNFPDRKDMIRVVQQAVENKNQQRIDERSFLTAESLTFEKVIKRIKGKKPR